VWDIFKVFDYWVVWWRLRFHIPHPRLYFIGRFCVNQLLRFIWYSFENSNALIILSKYLLVNCLMELLFLFKGNKEINYGGIAVVMLQLERLEYLQVFNLMGFHMNSYHLKVLFSFYMLNRIQPQFIWNNRWYLKMEDFHIDLKGQLLNLQPLHLYLQKE